MLHEAAVVMLLGEHWPQEAGDVLLLGLDDYVARVASVYASTANATRVGQD